MSRSRWYRAVELWQERAKAEDLPSQAISVFSPAKLQPPCCVINTQLKVYACGTMAACGGGSLNLPGMEGLWEDFKEEVILGGILLGRTWDWELESSRRLAGEEECLDIWFRKTACTKAENSRKWYLNLGHLCPIPGFTYFLPVCIDWQNRS